jgi:hypothetical protein
MRDRRHDRIGQDRFAVTLLEEVLLAGVPVLAIDPKGDLGNLALRFPDLAARDFAPWVSDTEVSAAGDDREAAAAAVAQRWRKGLAQWNIGPDRIAASVATSSVTVYTPGSTAGVPLNVVGFAGRPAGGRGRRHRGHPPGDRRLCDQPAGSGVRGRRSRAARPTPCCRR